jgi:hypothetical protein
MNLEATSKYLTAFFRSHLQEYRAMMKDAGATKYPLDFEEERDVIQWINNVVLNIEDNYVDLSVPEAYASPQLLLEALTGLRTLADQQLAKVEPLITRFNPRCPRVIQYAHEINLEVREAIDHALSLSKDAAAVQASPLELLRRIAARLPLVAQQISKRRADRPTLKIGDEYDVQDLLHAVLKLHFDDIRPEEWCPSYAGRSNRTDFLLKRESIVIEVKKTRSGLVDGVLGDQLIIDIAHYREHPDCRHLFCLVWDDGRLISNPEGFRKDLEKRNSDFVTVAIVG